MNTRPVFTIAVTATVLITAGASWQSFTPLADLASRSGINPGQAWAWPLIVDSIIVVATVAADPDVPDPVAAAAAVPPVALVAITHLTVQLTHMPHQRTASDVATDVEGTDRKSEAAQLRERGLSSRAFARRLRVHPSMVGRLLPAHNPTEVN